MPARALPVDGARGGFRVRGRIDGDAPRRRGGQQGARRTAGPTADTSVKTDPKAACFGGGTGGSGKSVSLSGDTALGLLADGAKTISQLAPLSITDHFEFGLALCGVGKSVVKGKASWYLKIDHKGATVAGNKVKIKPGDEVLWDLAPSYPYPEELVLSARPR